MRQRTDVRLAGTVRWAVVPYTPAPPFRLYAGPESEPILVPDVGTVIDAARRGGDAELSYIVQGKARPVLVLTDPPAAHHREVTALRLLRLSRLSPADRERVRAQGDELLFRLEPGLVDLPEESAVLVSALVRLNVDAIDTVAPPLGRLDEAELRVIGERLIRFYGFDVHLLLERQIAELVARHRARGTAP